MKSFINYVAEEKQDLGTLIRDALKKAGYKVPSQISVRKTRNGSYDVDIKTYKIDKDEIENLVRKFENVRYDERSYEILSGGNTFIFVDYDWNFARKEQERLSKLEDEIIKKAFDNEGQFIDVGKGLQICIPSSTQKIVNKPESYMYKLNGKLYREDYRHLPIWELLAKAGF